MTSHRKEKLSTLLERLAAEYLERESNRTALITITGSFVNESGRSAHIYYTVLPEDKEAAVSEFLGRKMSDFVAYIDKHARIGRMPKIKFTLDLGEKNRQRIEFLSEND